MLSLVMIVKNESRGIRETLLSAKPHVDSWTILDTGSTDGTQDIVREVMAGLPGALHDGPFVDFAQARNRALDLVGLAKSGFPEEPTFTLFLSGDEILHNGAALRAYLESAPDAGACCVEMRAENTSWYYPRVLRTSAKWRYVGAVHEVPVGPNGETEGPLIPGAYITYTLDQARWMKRMREFDLPTLTREVEDESRPLADRAQAIWFLGQTHEALADEHERTPGSPWSWHKFAAMACYRRRYEIGGPDRLKAAYARFRYLNVAEKVGVYTHREMVERVAQLIQIAPEIPEARYMLAVHVAADDADRGCALAQEAAGVARAVRERPSHLPTDSRIEWLSLRLAAECARAAGWPKKSREIAHRGVVAGGPKEMFEEYVR